jgi:uncharacterized protein with ATP-grasp and redox domains
VTGDPRLFFGGIRHMLSIASTQAHEGINTALFSNILVESVWDIMGSGPEGFYRNLKEKNNENAAGLLDAARDYIDERNGERESLERAFQVAAAGNVAPLGKPSKGFGFNEVKDVIHGRLAPVIQGDVYGVVKSARQVFYITDNAGEIGFDALLISKLKAMGCYVTLVVKQPMFFEDATLEDARFFGLDRQVDSVISVKNIFVPNDSMPYATAGAFEKVDLIISKGTGNFEALKGEVNSTPVIYMLKVKCDPIAESTNIKRGRFVVEVDRP